eukprot:11183301-Lingulodinium_polyedra.AAC.1
MVLHHGDTLVVVGPAQQRYQHKTKQHIGCFLNGLKSYRETRAQGANVGRSTPGKHRLHVPGRAAKYHRASCFF